ncbi:MAG TPA: hypothetical protein VIM56_06150 [Rhizomicrobium sp.]
MWELIIRCSAQVRANVEGIYSGEGHLLGIKPSIVGLDFPAWMQMAAVMGADRSFLSELLPEIEGAILMGSTEEADPEDEDPPDWK